MTDNNTPTVARRTVLRSAAVSSIIGLGATSAAGKSAPTAVEPALQNGDLIGEGPTLALEQVADGLSAPTDFTVADEDEDRQFVVDQTGQIHVLGDDGLEDEPFLDITDRMAEIEEAFDERGLLGLAFHPDFDENGQFYVRYSVDEQEPEYGAPDAEVPEEVNHVERLSQFETADDDNGEADPDSEEVLLDIPQPQFNHNAGPIAFGPDGYLYIATGDGGGGGDNDEGHVDDWYGEIEGGNGQDTEHNLMGGILRIDVDDDGDDERNYGIPDDNPLVDEDGHLDEYWSWGHRNPWGMSFENGELLAADVGQALFEIINHVEEGGNYGWNVWEGTHCFDPQNPEEPPEDCPDVVDEDAFDGFRSGEPLLGPVIEYPQEADMGRYGEEYEEAGTQGEDRDRIGVAIVGGRMYEGDEVDDLGGQYVFGDWSWDGQSGGRVFVAEPPEEWPEEVDDAEDDEVDDEAEDEDEDETDVDDEMEDEADDENDVANDEDVVEDERGENDVDEDDDEDLEAADDDDNGVDDENEIDDEDETDVEDAADDNDDEDPEAADDDTDDTDDEANGPVEDSDYHPPDEVDRWSIEEVTFEGESDAVEDGLLTQFVYAFGRDADGEVYVLTSDTPTVEGEGYVHRIVTADEDVDDDDVDDEDEPEADADEDDEMDDELDDAEDDEMDDTADDEGDANDDPDAENDDNETATIA